MGVFFFELLNTEQKGDLVGEIELPLALGRVGGATNTHPVRLFLSISLSLSLSSFFLVLFAVWSFK
jgi:hydroxymethylglutaryl-CoA reductase